MDATVIATLVGIALVVVALAAYLTVTALILSRANAAVSRVHDNLARVAPAAERLRADIDAVNEELAGAVGHLGGIGARAPAGPAGTSRGRRRRRN